MHYLYPALRINGCGVIKSPFSQNLIKNSVDCSENELTSAAIKFHSLGLNSLSTCISTLTPLRLNAIVNVPNTCKLCQIECKGAQINFMFLFKKIFNLL